MIASGSSTITDVSGDPRRQPNASSGAKRQTRVTSAGSQTTRSSASGEATTRIPCKGSSSGTEALRVVERGRRDERLTTIDLDTVGERGPPQPAEHERLAEQRGGPAPRDV